MIPGSVRRHKRVGVGVLMLAFAVLLGLAFARPALAQSSVSYCGLTFSLGDGQDVDAAVSERGGTITVNAPSGTLAISTEAGKEKADSSLQQIVVSKGNRATIELNGVKIDEFSDGASLHTLIFEGDTDLVVSGENEIFAQNTCSAIWSPARLTITGKGANPTLTLNDDAHANAAISLIAKDVIVGSAGESALTLNALLLGGTLVRPGVTRADGTITVHGGTVKAEKKVDWQQGIAAGTLTINGGNVISSMEGKKSHAVSATSVVVSGGSLEASGKGLLANAINAGTLTVRKAEGATGPTLKLASDTSAIGCPVILKASTSGSSTFYPWLAQGGDAAESLQVLSFAGAGNAQAAETTGISLGTKNVEIKPAALTKLAFTPSSDQGDGGTSDSSGQGVRANEKVYLELSYAFEGFDGAQPSFGETPLTTFFPVANDVVVPRGNAKTHYEGGTRGSIEFATDPKGRTTSISPVAWPLLESIYGDALEGGSDSLIKPLDFTMRYTVTLKPGTGTWISGDSEAKSYETTLDGKLPGTVPELTGPTDGSYELSYWQDSHGGAIGKDELASHVFTQSTELTAVWVEKKAEVTFHANGGTWDGEKTEQKLTVEQGKSFDPPVVEPTSKDGKLFLGWATTTNASTTLVDFTTETVSSATAEYFAQWGTPSLSLAPSTATATAGESFAYTATATIIPDVANQIVSLPALDAIDVAADPVCEIVDLSVGAGSAAFKVVAPELNGEAKVSASWAGQTATATLNVTGGIDPADEFYVTFQGNGGTWTGSVPFQTLTLSKGHDTLSSEQQETLLNASFKSSNSGKTFLAWYEWIEEAGSSSSLDSGSGITPAHGYWHSVDLSKKSFDKSTTLTAMWADASKQSLILWPLTSTVSPSAKVAYTVALLPEPLQTGVLPPYDYTPDKAVDLGKLTVRFVGDAYGATMGEVTVDATKNLAEFSVTAPAQATPPDTPGVIIEATYVQDGGEALGATATLTVQSNPSPSNPPKPTPPTPPTPSTDESVVAVHRLYNPYDGSHLLTIDAEEIRRLMPHGWKDEGEAFRLFSENREGRVPITRLYNPFNGDHHYVTSASEAHMLALSGWIDEGTCFYGASPDDGAPVYRLWNSLQRAHGGLGSHLWTSEPHEYAKLPTLDPAGAWKQEGIAWYAAHTAPTQ